MSMGWVILLLISSAVGALVYYLTGASLAVGATHAASSRTGFEAGGVAEVSAAVAPEDVREWAGGEVAPRPGTPARVELAPDTTVPVVGSGLSWHSRLNGVLGLVVAVGVGAAAIAFAMYGLGSLIVRLIGNHG
jgi:hypothetical protein